jgi:hypothetical protein
MQWGIFHSYVYSKIRTAASNCYFATDANQIKIMKFAYQHRCSHVIYLNLKSYFIVLHDLLGRQPIYYMSLQYRNKSKSQLTSPTPAQLPAVAVSSGHIVYLLWAMSPTLTKKKFSNHNLWAMQCFESTIFGRLKYGFRNFF